MVSVLNVAVMAYVPGFCVILYWMFAVPWVLVVAVPMGFPFMVKVICFPSMGLFWCPGAVSVSVAVICMVSLLYVVAVPRCRSSI